MTGKLSKLDMTIVCAFVPSPPVVSTCRITLRLALRAVTATKAVFRKVVYIAHLRFSMWVFRRRKLRFLLAF